MYQRLLFCPEGGKAMSEPYVLGVAATSTDHGSVERQMAVDAIGRLVDATKEVANLKALLKELLEGAEQVFSVSKCARTTDNRSIPSTAWRIILSNEAYDKARELVKP
jgi:hypothetical protein